MTSEARFRVKALLLAAGLGTRLRPLTEHTPKCLVPILGCPLLGYWFASLRETPIRDVAINTHHLRTQVAAYIDQVHQDSPFCVVESYEPELLGSAGTVTANRAWMDDADACLVVYTDNLSTVDLSALIRFHRSHDDPFTMLLFRTNYPEQCGIARLDDKGRIVEFEEKPKSPASNLANAGVYVVSADAYREIADRRAFDLGHDVIPLFAGRMRGWLFEGYHRDIGSLESLQLAEREAEQWTPRWSSITNVPSQNLPAPSPPSAGERAGVRGPADFGQGSERKAVFLDRDGTLIEHVHHLTDPAKVKLLPGVAAAIRRLHDSGYACVVVTNQSVVGRGMLSEQGLQQVHDEMARQLSAHDVELEAVYACPYAPTSTDPTVIEHPDRKPGPGMLLRAAEELSLDLGASWMIGDSLSDVLAGRNAGCKGAALLASPLSSRPAGLEEMRLVLAPDLLSAVDQIVEQDRQEAQSSR